MTSPAPISATSAPSVSGSTENLCRPVRQGLVILGWLNVGLGIIGIFLPLMPTTIFLLIALWAFSRSSRKFHIWLYTHPRLGKTLRDWHQHRAIPKPAKFCAVGTMAASWIILSVTLNGVWLLPLALLALLLPIAAFIVTRPCGPVRQDKTAET